MVSLMKNSHFWRGSTRKKWYIYDGSDEALSYCEDTNQYIGARTSVELFFGVIVEWPEYIRAAWRRE